MARAGGNSFLERLGLHVKTLNAARSGNTLQDSIDVFLNYVEQDKPDVVVVMHAANDVGVLLKAGSCKSRKGKSLSTDQILLWMKQLATREVCLYVLSPRLAAGLPNSYDVAHIRSLRSGFHAVADEVRWLEHLRSAQAGLVEPGLQRL